MTDTSGGYCMGDISSLFLTCMSVFSVPLGVVWLHICWIGSGGPSCFQRFVQTHWCRQPSTCTERQGKVRQCCSPYCRILSIMNVLLRCFSWFSKCLIVLWLGMRVLRTRQALSISSTMAHTTLMLPASCTTWSAQSPSPHYIYSSRAASKTHTLTRQCSHIAN